MVNLEQSIEGSWFIHKVGLPYSTFYVKEYAGVDPQTGKSFVLYEYTGCKWQL